MQGAKGLESHDGAIDRGRLVSAVMTRARQFFHNWFSARRITSVSISSPNTTISSATGGESP